MARVSRLPYSSGLTCARTGKCSRLQTTTARSS